MSLIDVIQKHSKTFRYLVIVTCDNQDSFDSYVLSDIRTHEGIIKMSLGPNIKYFDYTVNGMKKQKIYMRVVDTVPIQKVLEKSIGKVQYDDVKFVEL